MTKNDQINKRMFFYESFAGEFDSKMNMYDTNKRLQVIYNEMLPEDLNGKALLDAGCGTGWFSKVAAERGAIVTSMDLGERLLGEVAKKCESTRVVGSILEMPFADGAFDFVVSSEVIEHIPTPLQAFDELYRVLRPGGVLALTTPNRLWYFSVWLANKFHVRPYEGLENWISWSQMRNKVESSGFQIESMVGVHLVPFVSPLLYPLLDFFHRFNKPLAPFMVNMAIRCRK